MSTLNRKLEKIQQRKICENKNQFPFNVKSLLALIMRFEGRLFSFDDQKDVILIIWNKKLTDDKQLAWIKIDFYSFDYLCLNLCLNKWKWKAKQIVIFSQHFVQVWMLANTPKACESSLLQVFVWENLSDVLSIFFFHPASISSTFIVDITRLHSLLSLWIHLCQWINMRKPEKA